MLRCFEHVEEWICSKYMMSDRLYLVTGCEVDIDLDELVIMGARCTVEAVR